MPVRLGVTGSDPLTRVIMRYLPLDLPDNELLLDIIRRFRARVGALRGLGRGFGVVESVEQLGLS